jgi:succinate dehydrogenase / fumarate reductase cytochrome b subunit
MALGTETLDRSRGGMWPWLGQRVTAVLVIVTIMVHLVLTHYVAIGELSFDNIGDRLAGGVVLVNDIVLLVAVVFHALNGLRMVVLDWGLSGVAGRRVFDAVLWLVGTATVAYGVWALWVWVS